MFSTALAGKEGLFRTNILETIPLLVLEGHWVNGYGADGPSLLRRRIGDAGCQSRVLTWESIYSR